VRRKRKKEGSKRGENLFSLVPHTSSIRAHGILKNPPLRVYFSNSGERWAGSTNPSIWCRRLNTEISKICQGIIVTGNSHVRCCKYC